MACKSALLVHFGMYMGVVRRSASVLLHEHPHGALFLKPQSILTTMTSSLV
jgi:hypothetical protein